VALAARTGDVLPATPDSKALADYLLKRRSAAPSAFAELSHTVMRLIGPGQYLVERAGGTAPGHFGLAVKDYTHSTAPNRRYADLLTQRLVKAALAGDAVPYAEDELERLARHCTLQEDAANRVERQVSKSATALLVSGRVGETFEAVVSGASEKGTWVRISTPAIEGKLLKSGEDLDVGDHLRVRLTSVDVRQGFIDFERL
jgi:exoribonuclease R